MPRYLLLLESDSGPRAVRTVFRLAGLNLASTADLAGAEAATALSGSDGLLLHDLDVAVLTATEEQATALQADVGGAGPIMAVESVRTVQAITGDQATQPPAQRELTWGLRALGAGESTAAGQGVRVAVLDTGMSPEHPDFADRTVVTNSFVSGESAEDGNGHGTHVIGTACGPREPATGPGYGVAYDAEIYAGKVLDNSGSGSDAEILAGISWAVANNCRVVSMSLGAPVEPGQGHSETFEQAARRALRRGTLIVAAAGNDSRRSEGSIGPVGHPANCPSIMAVGAVDSEGAIADFSSGTVDPDGAVDVTGPGVEVYSSWPMPDRYRTISGTSMATPHVAGVAALLAEQHSASDWQLWARLCLSARRSALPSVDVGCGLVQAP